MTENEFKAARKARLKVSQADLAMMMQTPKRTIQDLESGGDKPVRGIYAVCLELLIWRDQVITQAVIEKVQAVIAKDHPNGIASEPA